MQREIKYRGKIIKISCSARLCLLCRFAPGNNGMALFSRRCNLFGKSRREYHTMTTDGHYRLPECRDAELRKGEG